MNDRAQQQTGEPGAPTGFPLDLADRCVKCGLCLPHCPTYVVTRDEADSPRGRIALMQGLTGGHLEASPRLLEHLDGCLTCRSCEAVCPSQVPYGRLIDAIRQDVEPRRPRGRMARGLRRFALQGLVPHRRRLRLAARVARVLERSGLRALGRVTGLTRLLGLARLEAVAPHHLEAPPRWRAYYPPHGPERGRVGLFLGCIGEIAEADALRATVEVLTWLGYGVVVPQTQTCCGALHQHNGDPDTARALAERNLAAFADAETVVFTASGCGAQLAEYDQLLGDDAAPFVGRLREVSAFLADHAWPEVGTEPTPRRIAVHTPCTLANVLRGGDGPFALLQRVPGIEPVALDADVRCCGAAGSYVITEPAMADQLRDYVLDALERLNVATLATTNIGCALHMTAGARERGLALEVVHPVQLLARQLAADNGERA